MADSPAFIRNGRLHHTGRKSFRHPVVGLITVDFDAMELPAQPGLTPTAYTAAPGTPDHDALQFFAASAATDDAETAGNEENRPPRR